VRIQNYAGDRVAPENPASPPGRVPPPWSRKEKRIVVKKKKKGWFKTDESLAIIRPKDRELAILTRKPKFRAECKKIEDEFSAEYKLLRNREGGIFGIEILKRNGCTRRMTAEELTAFRVENSDLFTSPKEPQSKKTISINPGFLARLEEFGKKWGVWPCDPVSISSPLEAPMGAVLYNFPVLGTIELCSGFSLNGIRLFLPVYANTTCPQIESIFPAITAKRKEVYGKEKGEKNKFEAWLINGDSFLGYPGIKIVIPIFPNTTAPLIKRRENWNKVEELKGQVFGKEKVGQRERDEFWDQIDTWDKYKYASERLRDRLNRQMIFPSIAAMRSRKRNKGKPINPNTIWHQYRKAHEMITGEKLKLRRIKPLRRLSEIESLKMKLIKLCLSCEEEKGAKRPCAVTGRYCKSAQNLQNKIDREELKTTADGKLKREEIILDMDSYSEYNGGKVKPKGTGPNTQLKKETWLRRPKSQRGMTIWNED
jgi:hypothetical protein